MACARPAAEARALVVVIAARELRSTRVGARDVGQAGPSGAAYLRRRARKAAMRARGHQSIAVFLSVLWR